MTDDVFDRIAARFARQAADNVFNGQYERPITLSLLPELAGRRVLDAGCGPGLYARILVDRGAQVTGVDASVEMIKLARAHVPEATFHHGDLTQPLPFADASFELVMSALCLDHVRDWRPVMREFARVLVPGGRLVFSTTHPMTDFELSQTGAYFEVERVEGAWPSFEVVVAFWRRPFHEVINPVLEAGFAIQRVVEAPLPGERAHRKPPFLWVLGCKP